MENNNELQDKILSDFRRAVGLNPTEPSNYNPKPKAIDLLQNFTGDPIKGKDPALTGKAPMPDNFASQAVDFLKKSAESSTSVDKMMKPFTYNADYDGANFERYYSHSKFKKLGFNPYRDNEALYNDNSTFGDEFVRAASQWPALVKSGFMSGVRSWETLFTDPLAPDLKGAAEMEKAMAIGSSSKKGVGSFAINTFLNSGYTVGIGAELLLEELALAGATALTGAALSEVTLPAMFARGASAASKIDKASDLVKMGNKLEDVKSFWTTTTGKGLAAVGRVINPLENTAGYAYDLYKGEKYAAKAIKEGSHAAEFAGWADGFGAFARDIMLIKSAVGEAKLEGGSVQMNVTKDLIQKYREANNGQDPPDAELQKIQTIAAEEAKRTALANLPAIMWSNKFMYETVMKPFEKTASKGIKDFIFDPVTKEVKKAPTDLLGKAGATLKSLTKPKAYKDFGLNYLKANLAEGVQENLQEAISAASASYAVTKYNNKDRGAYETYMGHFLAGLGDQLSAKGIETFAGGFLMGAMAQPIMGAPTWLAQKTWNNTVNRKDFKAYKETRDKELEDQAVKLTAMYQDPMRYFAPELANAIKQGSLSADFIDAVVENDKNKDQDVKSDAIFEHVLTALQTNTTDKFVERMQEMRKLSPEDAAKAFNVEDGAKALEMIDKVISRTQRLQDSYDAVNSEYPNPFNPSRHPLGSDAYKTEAIAYKAWSEAQAAYLFARDTFEENKERIAKIGQAFTGRRSPVANINAQDLYILLEPVTLEKHLLSLSNQARNLDVSIPEQKKEKASLEKTKDILTSFKNAVNNDDGPAAKKAFGKYLKHLSKGTGEFVFDKKLDDAFELIRDSLTLQNELGQLSKHINILSNPNAFMKMFNSINKGLNTAFENIYADVSERLKEKADTIELNRGFQRLLKEQGVYMDPDYIESFTEALSKKERPTLPTSFVTNLDQKFISSGPVFEEALKIWNETLDLLHIPAETKVEKKIDEEEKPVKTKPEAKLVDENSPIQEYGPYMQEVVEVVNKLAELNEIYDDEEFNLFMAKQMKENPIIKSIRDKLNKERGLITEQKEEPEISIGKEETTDLKGIPFAITTQVKQELADLGYSKDDIYKMRPEEAQSIIESQTTKPKAEPVVEKNPLGDIEKITDLQELKTFADAFAKASIATDFYEGVSVLDIEQALTNKEKALLKTINKENLKWAAKNNKSVILNDPKNPDISGQAFSIKVGSKYVTLSRPSLTLKKLPMEQALKMITEIVEPSMEKPTEPVPAETKATAEENLMKAKELADKNREEATNKIKEVEQKSISDVDNDLLDIIKNCEK